MKGQAPYLAFSLLAPSTDLVARIPRVRSTTKVSRPLGFIVRAGRAEVASARCALILLPVGVVQSELPWPSWLLFHKQEIQAKIETLPPRVLVALFCS